MSYTHRRSPLTLVLLPFALLLLLLLTLLPSPCDGLIHHLRLSHDRRSVYHLGSFGYDNGGVLKLEVKDLEVQRKHAEKDEANGKIGIFMG